LCCHIQLVAVQLSPDGHGINEKFLSTASIMPTWWSISLVCSRRITTVRSGLMKGQDAEPSSQHGSTRTQKQSGSRRKPGKMEAGVEAAKTVDVKTGGAEQPRYVNSPTIGRKDRLKPNRQHPNASYTNFRRQRTYSCASQRPG